MTLLAHRKVLATEVRRHQPFDVYLLFVVLLLVLLGTVMVFSSSAISARERFQDSYYFLKRELIYVSAGLFLMFLVKKIPYRVWWRAVYPLLGLAFVLMLSTHVFGGGPVNGAARWIRVGGFSFQPAELTKLAIVIFMAYVLAKKQERIRDFVKGFVPVISVAGVFILLTLAQRDLGGAVIIAAIVAMMLFVAGTRITFLAGIVLLSLPVLYQAVFSVEFRRRRILAFLDPWRYQLDSGFQIIQSFVAFQSGGLTGVGLGEGKQKLFYLPEAHTDFIFSVIGEELGLLGVLAVVTLFTFFVFRGFMITLRSRDLFGLYLSFGITALIGLQAFVNMAVVMGLFPTKGLVLPFLSYGGTALLVDLVAVGILLNISTDTEGET